MIDESDLCSPALFNNVSTLLSSPVTALPIDTILSFKEETISPKLDKELYIVEDPYLVPSESTTYLSISLEDSSVALA
jgi:hypothetical protein